MPRIGFSPATKGTFLKTVAVPADEFGLPYTNPPGIVDLDNLTLYKFTLNDDQVTYKLPVPSDYHSGDATFSVIWTNAGDTDDNGKVVKWRLDYQVGGEGDVISGDHGSSPKNTEDTYTSALGWVEHHSGIVTIAEADFLGRLCLFLKLSAVTPVGTPLTGEPHLIGVCYTYRAIWGRKP